MAHFLGCLASGQRPTPSGADGLTIMQIVDAAYQSSHTGDVVKI